VQAQAGIRPQPKARNQPDSAPRSLRSLLTDTASFPHIVELVTTRGQLARRDAARVVSLASQLAESGFAHALSITDNPGGNPSISPESLGLMLLEREQEVIIHLSAKDQNRNALESRSWMLASLGFENLLCLSGDYPIAGYQGTASPVFDIDSVALLDMLEEMNRGLHVPGRNGNGETVLPRTDLYLGATVSPFKQQERELLPQYYKLFRKVSAGARYIITQVGFDSRKLDELLNYMELRQIDIPAVANVYVLSPGVARYFHQGKVPGVVVSDALLDLVEKQTSSPDRGKRFFLELAAKQIAVARGLGFSGAYVGGKLSAQDFQTIFSLVGTFGPDDWRVFAREIQFPLPDQFHLFELDEATGLNSTDFNPEYLASLATKARGGSSSRIPLAYRFSRLVHEHLFEEGSGGFSAGQRIYARLRHPGSEVARRGLHAVERATKAALFDCRDCGDCSLPDIAYLCPESQCAKNQRNGPCGGSLKGMCEAQDKECIWARAYDRLKPYGEEERMLSQAPVLTDCTLRGTSSWANGFLGHDYRARQRRRAEDDISD
jgi:methylenetetrahydrofolate reductase (NADPH)